MICGAYSILCGGFFIVVLIELLSMLFFIYMRCLLHSTRYCIIIQYGTIWCLLHYVRWLIRYIRCYLLAMPSSHYIWCFFRYNHGAPLSFDFKRGQQHRKVWVRGIFTKMAASLEKLDVMARILKKLSLGHLTEL